MKRTICGYGLEFVSSQTGYFYDIADIYPTLKVILTLLYLCQYIVYLDGEEIEQLKKLTSIIYSIRCVHVIWN